MRKITADWWSTSIAVGFSLRLFLACVTYGTNDVTYWKTFHDTILDCGLVCVYERVWYFNHPPLMALYLKGLSSFTVNHPAWFPFLIRLPAVLADALSFWLVYQLFARFWNREAARRASAVVAMSPVLILVSGFHGNTDPVFVSLLLLAAYILLVPGWTLLAGIVFGLSMSIKIVPVLAIPFFFFWLADWRRRFLFFSGVGAMLVAGFGYHFAVIPQTFFGNVFAYGSTSGLWGVSELLKPLGLWTEGMARISKCLLVLALWLKAYQLTTGAGSKIRDPKALLQGLGWTFWIFLVVTPGFGMQYLAWFVAPSLFLSFKQSVRYNLFAGVLAFSAYNNWCDGSPWWMCGSATWNAWEGILAFGIWVFLIRWMWKQRATKLQRI